MADKQSGAKAEASSRGLILRVLSPEEPLCLFFLSPFPIGIQGSRRALQSSPPVHTQAQNRTTHIRTRAVVWAEVAQRCRRTADTKTRSICCFLFLSAELSVRQRQLIPNRFNYEEDEKWSKYNEVRQKSKYVMSVEDVLLIQGHCQRDCHSVSKRTAFEDVGKLKPKCTLSSILKDGHMWGKWGQDENLFNLSWIQLNPLACGK